MIEWSLNPKKPVLTRKSADQQQVLEPLADSKHANKKPIDPANQKDDKNSNVEDAAAVDLLCDEDDLDALEALAAAENDIPPPPAVATEKKSSEEEDNSEPKSDSN
jgi:uracil-DNA glycosylase